MVICFFFLWKWFIDDGSWVCGRGFGEDLEMGGGCRVEGVGFDIGGRGMGNEMRWGMRMGEAGRGGGRE